MMMTMTRPAKTVAPRVGFGILITAGVLLVSGCVSSDAAPAGSDSGIDFPAATGTDSPLSLEQEEWDAVVEAANAEGELVVYASQAGSDETFAAFSETYPDIHITVVREAASDLLPRVDQELSANAPGADVTYHSSPSWALTHVEAGDMAALQLGPDAQAAGWADFAVGDYYIPVLANPYMIGWNTEVGEPVANIEELIEKAGDTPVGIAEPISQNGMFQLQTWIDVYGEEILGDLASLNYTVIRSTTPLAQSLASGEVGYAVLMTPGLLDALQEEGAPVEQSVPDDGNVTGFAYGPMLLANAEHPAAAQVFVNWLLSQPTQQLMVDHHGPMSAPVIMDGTTGALEWGDVDPVDDADWPQERREEFRALWDEYFVS